MSKRRNNGEGSVSKIVQKVKRTKFLDDICEICKKCDSKCNRSSFEKCDKCANCKNDCLKYCDRYYCNEMWVSKITLNGKQKTIATAKTKREAIEKKKEAEAQLLTKTYIKRNPVTILELIKKADKRKFEANRIKQTTVNRNQFYYKKIENSEINKIPVQKLSSEDIQNFLNLQIESSQSEINNLFLKIKIGFTEAVNNKIIRYEDNPTLKVEAPISNKNKLERLPLKLEEEKKLLSFLANAMSNQIIKNPKSKYSDITIRNIIILALLTGCRIGELGALDYTTHIDFENKYIKIERTLTENEREKPKIGNTTKTGTKKRLKNLKDIHYVPFNLFDGDIVEYILQQQIKYAKNIKNNKDNLLFITKEGACINHSNISAIFHKILNEVNIHYNTNYESLSFHSLRHTVVTRLIELGEDLNVISKIVGHASLREIDRTYGHILQQFQAKQIENPRSFNSKEDIISEELKKQLLNMYE